jgi:hypothetical protein
VIRNQFYHESWVPLARVAVPVDKMRHPLSRRYDRFMFVQRERLSHIAVHAMCGEFTWVVNGDRMAALQLADATGAGR